MEPLRITVTDDGIPFNPLEVAKPDTSLPLEDREIGGLGIHFVLSMVDELTYERTDHRNIVTLSKSRSFEQR